MGIPGCIAGHMTRSPWMESPPDGQPPRDGEPPRWRPPWMETPLTLDGDPPGWRPPRMENPPRWRTPPDGEPPWMETPFLDGDPPSVNVRAVRILLECILAFSILLLIFQFNKLTNKLLLAFGIISELPPLSHKLLWFW